MNILDVFWENVDWHRKNKKIPWYELVGGNSGLATSHKLNVSLKRAQEIAELLDIDDYAILFEPLD
ncbi:hypothetical protein [Enterococcus alishanensis]|uniref:XRE family transcriptional regulator n=1 Tax=Enterococcus alishanensis TaxID=1303817 RepID=A0ABS6TDT8_9ENTE|nr:hypothetical protein [Enterococcus alishanensis]MBV7391075.1 hypothetical protein [Enterococcus alishanensis]